MKIFITTPSYAVHGGIRIILEWANRLSDMHEVFLYSLNQKSFCNWFPISQKVKVVRDTDHHFILRNCDCIIITSPHSAHYLDMQLPAKKFVFMQMAEHLFRPADKNWFRLCQKFYTANFPLISISQWNIEMLLQQFNRTAPVYYVGNGVNLDHFPISTKEKDGETILVEGWESSNPSKDPDHVAPQVAERLKVNGYKILAYSALPLKSFTHVPDEYYQQPSLGKLNELYERATILIKASKFDARSCAPMEAMTKGTVTARAINNGDDDLIHFENALVSSYDKTDLYRNTTILLNDHELRKRLSQNCIQHVQQYSWNYYLSEINTILCNA